MTLTKSHDFDQHVTYQMFRFVQLVEYRPNLNYSNLDVVAEVLRFRRSVKYFCRNCRHRVLRGALECAIVKSRKLTHGTFGTFHK